MKKGLKAEVSQPLIYTILVVVLVGVIWYGWNAMRTDGERRDGRAIVDAAARLQASHGIDIKTVPTWSTMWYKYHPEYKGPHPPVKMPDFHVAPPGGQVPAGAPGATPGPS